MAPRRGIDYELRWLKRDCTEWEYAWTRLRQVIFHPPKKPFMNTAEQWEYVGTFPIPSQSQWSHEFRHRYHPCTGRKETVLVHATTNDDVHYVF